MFPSTAALLASVERTGNFPKTTLQYEGDNDVDAMLFVLEIPKYGQSLLSVRATKKVFYFTSMLVVLSDAQKKGTTVWPRTAESSSNLRQQTGAP